MDQDAKSGQRQLFLANIYMKFLVASRCLTLLFASVLGTTNSCLPRMALVWMGKHPHIK
jgi:hypothetical protein